ncbi:unnamed protein product [Ascophyllum nodosum]
MPGFRPLADFLRLLRRLWPLLRQLLLITSLSLPPALALVLRKLIGARRRNPPELPFSDFWRDANEGRLSEVLIADNHVDVKLRPGLTVRDRGGASSAAVSAAAATEAGERGITRYRSRLLHFVDGGDLVDLLARQDTAFGAKDPPWGPHIVTALLTVLPFAYIGIAARVLTRSNRLGKDDDGVGRAVARGGELIRSVSFADVAGADEAKAELAELVDFLGEGAARYADVGARLPRGVLLSGPSGTGKTLLARAMAAEAGVPFFSCSASDFVEMLVGRGAARVRDLFQRGVASQPSIIFIDELDALAKVRGGINSNDEREQTLNQLLTEMDGFDSEGRSVLVVAATNRPEVLDPALTRPGRFDRHVTVGLPNEAGRRGILEVHSKKVRMRDTSGLGELARSTAGFSGAELANVINEAAMLAARHSELDVGPAHLRMAVARTKAYREEYNLARSPSILEIVD